MGKKLINNINDKTTRVAFLNFLKNKIGLNAHLFLEELSEISEVYIFSGVVRNFFIGYNGDIRDFDIVVKAENNELEVFLANLAHVRNSFGGYKLSFGSLNVDLWHIESTWAYEKHKISPELFKSYLLPNTAFFNFSSIIYDYKLSRFIYSNNFLEFLGKKEIDLVLKVNPKPQLCIVNTIYYHQKFNLAISSTLKKYCIVEFANYSETDFNAVQLKHFKEIKYEYAYIKEYVKIFKRQVR